VSIKVSRIKHIRFTIEIGLSNKEARTAFKNRLSSVRDPLFPPSGPMFDSLWLMMALFDHVDLSV
jgi:hypothetical protein